MELKSETAVLTVLKAPILQRDSQCLNYVLHANINVQRFAKKKVNYRVKCQIYDPSGGGKNVLVGR